MMSTFLQENKPKSKISQSSFLYVKQRLDYYYLPTDFPIETTPLLEQLIQKLDENNKDHMSNNINNQFQAYKQSRNDNNKQLYSVVDLAVRHEMSKVIKQNNILHDQVMVLKEQLSTMRHQLSKVHVNKHNTRNQMNTLTELNNARQRQLCHQLEEVKYKYNELMNLIHNDTNEFDREYIKRLLKHKNYNFDGDEGNNQSRIRATTTDNFNKQNTLGSSRKVGNNDSELTFLYEKLENRENEIRRIKSKLEFDGINMNKVLKDFMEFKNTENISKIKERVNYLEQQNKTTVDQNTKMKKTGGDKQALRDHIVKLQKQVKQLQSGNNNLKKTTKEAVFDGKKQRSSTLRKLNQTNSQMQSIMKEKITQSYKSTDLQRKLKSLISRNEQLVSDLEKEKQLRIRKQIQLQNSQKVNQNSKLMNEYEHQKHSQTEQQLLQKLLRNTRQLQEQKVLSVRLMRENGLLRQSVTNLQRIQEQLMLRKGHSNSIDSTNYFDRHQSTAIQFYKQQINQLKSKGYNDQGQLLRGQRQAQSLTLMLDKCRRECQLLLEQNRILNKLTIETNANAQIINNLKKQRTNLKQSLQIERQRNIRIQAERQQLQLTSNKISKDYQIVKEQFISNQRILRQARRSYQLNLSQLQQKLETKRVKLVQTQVRVRSLQTQLGQFVDRQRNGNKQVLKLEEQLHQIRKDKNKNDKALIQCQAQCGLLRDQGSGVRQIRLRGQLQSLYKQSKAMKQMQQQLKQQIGQLITLKQQLEVQVRERRIVNEKWQQVSQQWIQKEEEYKEQIKRLKEQ